MCIRPALRFFGALLGATVALGLAAPDLLAQQADPLSRESDLRTLVTDHDFHETVVLVQVKAHRDIDSSNAHKRAYDAYYSELTYGPDSVYQLHLAEDLPTVEEDLPIAKCFIPNMKLVFKHYTYAISLYCTTSVKYRNQAPYHTGPEIMPSDLIFSESVLAYLFGLQQAYFHEELSQQQFEMADDMYRRQMNDPKDLMMFANQDDDMRIEDDVTSPMDDISILVEEEGDVEEDLDSLFEGAIASPEEDSK